MYSFNIFKAILFLLGTRTEYMHEKGGDDVGFLYYALSVKNITVWFL